MPLQLVSPDSGQLLNVKVSTILLFLCGFYKLSDSVKISFLCLVSVNSWSKSKSITVLDVGFLIQCGFSIGSAGNSSLVHLQPCDSCPAPTSVVTGRLMPYQVGRGMAFIAMITDQNKSSVPAAENQ